MQPRHVVVFRPRFRALPLVMSWLDLSYSSCSYKACTSPSEASVLLDISLINHVQFLIHPASILSSLSLHLYHLYIELLSPTSHLPFTIPSFQPTNCHQVQRPPPATTGSSSSAGPTTSRTRASHPPRSSPASRPCTPWPLSTGPMSLLLPFPNARP
jgi:hypothetical protein